MISIIELIKIIGALTDANISWVYLIDHTQDEYTTALVICHVPVREDMNAHVYVTNVEV